MRYAGVVRLLRQDFIQDDGRLLLFRVALVVILHPVPDEYQRVENRRLPVFGVSQINLLHRPLVSERASPVIERVVVLVENLQGRDVIPLPLSFRPRRFCFFNGGLPALQFCCRGWLPDRMEIAHRDAPVAHCAPGVSDGDFGERLFCGVVPERVQQRRGAIELFLSRRIAGNPEVNLSELFRGFVLVLVRFLRPSGGGQEGHQQGCEQKLVTGFHITPPLIGSSSDHSQWFWQLIVADDDYFRAASCPHAAEMSCPRGRRMNAGTPLSVRICWNFRMRPTGEERKGSSGAGLCGIRLTFALMPLPLISFTSRRA